MSRNPSLYELYDALTAIRSADHAEAMPALLQNGIAKAGFESFAFLCSPGGPARAGIVTTLSESWQETYVKEGFGRTDPCVARAMQTDKPFFWSDIVISDHDPNAAAARSTMQAASEAGFVDGLVIPMRPLGGGARAMRASCGLYWTNKREDIRGIVGDGLFAVRILATSWSEHFASVGGTDGLLQVGAVPMEEVGAATRPLTGREVDVLSWAAKGKTVAETALILDLGVETVRTHIVHACRRLKAANKTQAVAMAILGGLIHP